MPIRRKLEEAVPILLPLLDEMMEGLNDQDPAFGRLKKIRGYFEGKKDLFRNLKNVEDDLLQKFTVLEEEIDNSKYTNTDAPQGTPRHSSKKLDSIEKIRESIDGLISKFQIEGTDSSRKAESAAHEARKISEEWSALKVEDLILDSPAMSSLQLNYNMLDVQMKLCLLCFSIFPANSVIKKRPLVYWWIGEGYVTKTKDKTAMEEGDRIFGELINKGFLIAQYKPRDKGQDKNPIVDSCKMHSWIRLMLIRIDRDAKLFDSDAPGPGPGTRSRSVCLVPPTDNGSAGGPPEQPANQAGADPDTSRLLTLFNVNEQYLNIPHDWFSKENKIVVLQLGRWKDSAKHHKEVENEDHQKVENEDHIEVENEDFLKALGTKKHLKYLSLRGISRITEIPSTIRKLINLEILDLRACHNLEKLPSDISSLKKLTHLDISECYLLEGMPKGLDKLSSLQVLKGFVVATSKKGPGRLGDVAGLKKLRKLTLYIPSDAYIEEPELGKLKEVSALRILSITWGGGRGGGGGRVQAETEPSGKTTTIDRKKSFASKKDRHQVPRTDIKTMGSLSFPQKLEKLDLWCIPCETKPAWLNPDELKSLKKLYIRGGKLHSLSFEGNNNKWNVRILRLKYLHDLKVDEEQLRGDFPRLNYLEIKDKIMGGKGEDEHGGSSQQQQEQVLNN
ncbi:hypothetical protein PVL29_003722 [Vitis rotundifolia]|uniref:Disease resistance RPP13-like protein 4 n=1 Tax=Vitis rotundifolia TaxID=103349 RepID=A0AA39E2E6_VITRO|nr:hypothetical protein PVL29_003722 [Vitis rotundifolia]